MNKPNLILAVALAVGLSTAVLAQGMKGHEGMDMQKMQHTQPGASDAPSNEAFRDAHMKMMQNMKMDYTGNTDVDFVQGMIPHHQGAIDMAKAELQYGKDPELRKLAQNIIGDQEKEIGQMQSWLKKNKN
jgi:uncharacterized protein (DUF305 family)